MVHTSRDDHVNAQICASGAKRGAVLPEVAADRNLQTLQVEWEGVEWEGLWGMSKGADCLSPGT